MDLNHRKDSPLSDYAQEEREFLLAQVAEEVGRHWRDLYGELDLAGLKAEAAAEKIKAAFKPKTVS